jgi:hypothetical protein
VHAFDWSAIVALALMVIVCIAEYALGGRRLATGTLMWTLVVGTFYAVSLFFR